MESKNRLTDEVIILSANSKNELLQKLDNKDFSVGSESENYRLSLFNPTSERIDKAKSIIAKDKPWKGKMDIWFNNHPLLKNNGKIAFLFPGFDPTANLDVESIINYFDLPKKEYELENTQEQDSLFDQTLRLYKSSMAVDAALKKLGIVPDVNAGHSLGEWNAIKASDLVSDSSVKNMIKALNSDGNEIEDAFYLVAGCGYEKIKSSVEKIPNLYLANDNCTNQILLCGTRPSLEIIIEVLKKEQVYYQVLPFKSGFHTPFVAHKIGTYMERTDQLDIQKSKIPIWSATTLELYPESIEGFKELTVKHLTSPVRFRELTEKLYEKEHVRVFIQIGHGSLVGFIDDTLKQKEYSALSTYSNLRPPLEQLRRVVALLFIEGKMLGLSFLANKKFEINKQNAVNQEIEKTAAPVVQNTTLNNPVTTKPIVTISPTPTIGNISLSKDISHPVMEALNENIQEMIQMQVEMANLFEQNKAFITANRFKSRPIFVQQTSTANNQPKAEIAPINTEIIDKKKKFEIPYNITMEEHPYVKDHTIVKQPKHWKHWRDLSPVIPMTMTLELLGETAKKQDPSKKLLQMGPLSVFQWMMLNKPFVQTIEGAWKNDDTITLSIKNYANGEFVLGDKYPEVPAKYNEPIDFGKNLKQPPTPAEIYESHMFHGPAYQSITEITNLSEKGIRAIIKKSSGKGSLLDCLGQTIGLYSQLTLTENFVSFPVKVDEIKFYQDINDQEGLFELIFLIDYVNDEFLAGDFIIKRDGKVWCTVKNWQNRRFSLGLDLWNAIMWPHKNILAEEIYPGVMYYSDYYKKAIPQDFMFKQYLNYEEKEFSDTLPLNKRRPYLVSRIALKDSVRRYITKNKKKEFFPIEFFFKKDENGKPYVYGLPETEGLEISLAHKGADSVAITSDKPVGIDIESIEERSKNFMEVAFSENELELLKNMDNAQWTTRFWVAKEAYSKMLGTGLKGNPKQYEVESVDGDLLSIRGTKIKTIQHNNYIVGWTI